jgi:phosphatidylserine decarboxylase
MPTSPVDKILTTFLLMLPARLIARCAYGLSRSRIPWLKNSLIKVFLALYNVNTAEADRPVPTGYVSFNDFFTRELKPGARPLAGNSGNMLCPADGTLVQAGKIVAGELVQAKGMMYTAQSLLGDAQFATRLADSAFATVYLAPYNYHRVHMPLDGKLTSTRFIPGKLYSVNARTTANIPNLYAANERLVCFFEGTRGSFAMVLVGAMNVASISTAWAGEILPGRYGLPVHHVYSADEGMEFNAGDYMGHFNLGSTVILLGPPGSLNWDAGIQPGVAVQMGEQLGRF